MSRSFSRLKGKCSKIPEKKLLTKVAQLVPMDGHSMSNVCKSCRLFILNAIEAERGCCDSCEDLGLADQHEASQERSAIFGDIRQVVIVRGGFDADQVE